MFFWLSEKKYILILVLVFVCEYWWDVDSGPRDRSSSKLSSRSPVCHCNRVLNYLPFGPEVLEINYLLHASCMHVIQGHHGAKLYSIYFLTKKQNRKAIEGILLGQTQKIEGASSIEWNNTWTVIRKPSATNVEILSQRDNARKPFT